MASPSSRLALLIGSSLNDLEGTINDVESMQEALELHMFHVTCLMEQDSTRKGILEAWDTFIESVRKAREQIKEEPVVVVYYTGHGGITKPPNQNSSDRSQDQPKRQYQFLVPWDYKTDGNEFNGILDIEVADLLERTTNETTNVTIILDCCHSGRMARDPSHPNAKPKRLAPVQHDALPAFLKDLQSRNISDETTIEGNKHSVRIMAAASEESAWEDIGKRGIISGVLTEHLVRILSDPNFNPPRVAWRTIMLRVSALITVEFPQQNPRVEGAFKRIVFSTDESDTASYRVYMENGQPVLQGGTIHGVREGDVYSVMLSDSEVVIQEDVICEIVITGQIESDKSFAVCDRSPTGIPLGTGGALAFLKERKLYRWPTAYPQGLPNIKARLERSRFLKPYVGNDPEAHLVEIKVSNEQLQVLDRARRLVFSTPLQSPISIEAINEVVRHAEEVSRKHHLLSLQSGTGKEKLEHNLNVELVLDHQEIPLAIDGTAEITEGSQLSIRLVNSQGCAVHVNAFAIDGASEISHLTPGKHDGIPVLPEDSYTIQNQGRGLKMSWPNDLAKTAPVSETLVFIITHKPADLRHFVTRPAGYAGARRCASQASPLERLASHLAYGTGRGPEPEYDGDPLKYDVVKIFYLLRPRAH